jgi:hypothetical protein
MHALSPYRRVTARMRSTFLYPVQGLGVSIDEASAICSKKTDEHCEAVVSAFSPTKGIVREMPTDPLHSANYGVTAAYRLTN